jgi:DnaJ-class molecular chaperone
VLQAYAVLRDPTQRAGYDHVRTAQARAGPAGSGASSWSAVPIPVDRRKVPPSPSSHGSGSGRYAAICFPLTETADVEVGGESVGVHRVALR